MKLVKSSICMAHLRCTSNLQLLPVEIECVDKLHYLMLNGNVLLQDLFEFILWDLRED